MANVRSRRVLALAILIVVVAGCVRALDTATPIFSYRTVDERTLVVGTVTGPATWTRITTMSETPTTIAIGVSSWRAPLPGAGGDILELTVSLAQPIGDRTVVDAYTGLPVERAKAPE